MSRRPRLIVTLGDPCGIGPELLLKAALPLEAMAELMVVGPRAGIDLLEATAGAPVSWGWSTSDADGTSHLEITGSQGETARVRWLDTSPELAASQLQLGEGGAASGEATLRAIREGARRVLAGEADALVTLPMSKAAVHQAGYPIPGHTEFLAELAGAPAVRMAFVSPTLQVVLHTVHQSLRSVVEGLDPEAVAETLFISASRFVELLGRPDLRVALCALNPHAGEGGAFGDEEDALHQALAQARAQVEAHPLTRSVRLSGPLPSDTLFARAVQGEFDVVVALYHDQGLIPIKVLEPDRAVNLTLGLPYIRTSPDHGTAFDKAGQWIARPANFLEAARVAVRLAGTDRLITLPERP